MIDFFELEHRCKKLKRKKFIKFFTILILIFTLIGAIIYFLKQPKIQKSPQKEIKTKDINHTKPKIIPKKEKPVVIIKKIIIEKNVTPIQKPKPAPMLNVNIDFQNINDINITKKPSIQKPKQKPISIQTQTHNIKPKQKISVIQEETITFKKAFVLAKQYYENGDYQNSIKWCKIASKIDNTDERIWKLYALNLVKIGKKDKAIKILKTYLEFRDSTELKYLLQRLTQ